MEVFLQEAVGYDCFVHWLESLVFSVGGLVVFRLWLCIDIHSFVLASEAGHW